LVAGHETTANQISNICFVLLKDRDRWVELTRQPDLVPQAVEELLRVAPVTATAGFSRRALEDVQVGSQLVRAGERVMPTVFAANHDPAVFPDPDIVDFGRPNRTAHVAFSHGAHHCPGNQLARLELQVALEGLLRRFPGLDLAVPAGSIPWARSTLSRGPLCLPVTW
jgi:cytochrome P450